MKDIWYFLLIFLFINACSKKNAIDLGNGYRFDYDPVISGDKVILGPYENTYAVDGHVVGYGFDSTFIIAEQKPREFIEESTYSDPKMNFEKSEEIFKKSELRHFWIIRKKDHQVYGPLTKSKYLKKRQEIGVSKTLKLDIESQAGG